MEKQLNEIEEKSNAYLSELVEVKAKHALEVKELRTKIAELSKVKQDEEHFNIDHSQLVQLNINIIACEDAEDDEFARDENSTKEMSEKNSKLKKQIVKEKKIAKKLQEELDSTKNELYGLRFKNEEFNQYTSEEMQKLRDDLISKMEMVDQLESENRQLEVRAEKAEEEARNALLELQQVQDQNEEHNDKFGDQDEQIAQMHEDMQRLLEFKNELEVLIEEQNKDIEKKQRKIDDLTDEITVKDADTQKLTEYLKNLEKQYKEAKSKYNQVNSSYNRLKQGKIAELQKKITDLNGEIEILKEMVKSSKNEVRTKEISLQKFQRRIASLERISKIKSKASEIYSIQSQNSQRNRSMGRQQDTYDYNPTQDEDEEQNDEAIAEADESLEATGPQDPRLSYPQPTKSSQYSKTPNIRVSKQFSNSKAADVLKDSSEKLKPDFSIPKMEENRSFKGRVNKLHFENEQPSFILPVIKESQGAVILDRRKLEMLKKDIDNSKNIIKISNTYKQSYNIY